MPFEQTEGEILAVCSHYGETENVNLVKDSKTTVSRGFEDMRSTVLEVGNLSESRVGGTTI